MKKLTPEQKSKIYCVKHGHSDVLTRCFGYLYCGRCGDQIGDVLGGAFNFSGYYVFDGCPNRNCKICREIIKNLSKSDLKVLKKLEKERLKK